MNESEPDSKPRSLWGRIAEAFRDCEHPRSPIEVANIVFNRLALADELLESYCVPPPDQSEEQ